MNEVDLKIEKLCNKLEYIVKYSNNISVNITYDAYKNIVYRISILNSDNDIFSIVADNLSCLMKVYNKGNYYKSSDSSSILVDRDNENIKKLMKLIKDKYENRQNKKMIEKIDESLEIIDKINDRIFKED